MFDLAPDHGQRGGHPPKRYGPRGRQWARPAAPGAGGGAGARRSGRPSLPPPPPLLLRPNVAPPLPRHGAGHTQPRRHGHDRHARAPPPPRRGKMAPPPPAPPLPRRRSRHCRRRTHSRRCRGRRRRGWCPPLPPHMPPPPPPPPRVAAPSASRPPPPPRAAAPSASRPPLLYPARRGTLPNDAPAHAAAVRTYTCVAPRGTGHPRCRHPPDGQRRRGGGDGGAPPSLPSPSSYGQEKNIGMYCTSLPAGALSSRGCLPDKQMAGGQRERPRVARPRPRCGDAPPPPSPPLAAVQPCGAAAAGPGRRWRGTAIPASTRGRGRNTARRWSTGMALLLAVLLFYELVQRLPCVSCLAMWSCFFACRPRLESLQPWWPHGEQCVCVYGHTIGSPDRRRAAARRHGGATVPRGGAPRLPPASAWPPLLPPPRAGAATSRRGRRARERHAGLGTGWPPRRRRQRSLHGWSPPPLPSPPPPPLPTPPPRLT